MKPFLEQIETEPVSSIKVETYVQSLIDVPLHYHPHHEIVYIQKGSGVLLLADIQQEFHAEEIFFIRGNVPHLFQEPVSASPARRSKVSVIQYSQSLFSHFKPLPEFRPITDFEESIHYGIRMSATARMKTLLKSIRHADGIFRFNYLTELLSEIVSAEKVFLGSLSRLPHATHISHIRLKKMNSFLAEYCFKDLTLEEVAGMLQLSKTSLSRFLKRETGKTFSEHLNFHRINYSCSLLRESDANVMEVCFSSGYSNPAYFFRQFKKHKGCTPAEYRKKNMIFL